MTHKMRAAAAAALLVTILGGFPLALIVLIGNPWPGWSDVSVGDLSDTACVDILGTVSWLAWAFFTQAVLSELLDFARTIRRPTAPRRPAPRSGHRQLARTLVAATLSLTAVAATLPGVANATTAATSAAVERHPKSHVQEAPEPAVTSSLAANDQHQTPPSSSSSHHVVTVHADGPRSYWELAATYLGSGERWREIWKLNQGRTQRGGLFMTTPHVLRTGWTVIVPTFQEARSSPAAARSTAVPGRPVAGPAIIRVNGHSSRYTVRPGDTLSHIAQEWLGDSTRWPEICRLNQHRHSPPAGVQLRDCDLIYPGWEIDLPLDVPPAAHHRPAARSNDHVLPRASRATAAPRTTSVATTPRPENSTIPDTSATHEDIHRSDDGIEGPGTFVPWELASAITAAIALLWLKRRRRHSPGDLDDDPTDLPPLVLDIHEHVAQNPALAMQPDLAEPAADVPTPLLPPTGGVGLVGDGAQAAARAVMVSVLAAGGPRDFGHQGEIIIDRRTLDTIIEDHAAPVGQWPRLHIAENLAEALAMVESRTLLRRRILDQYDAPDLVTLRLRHPDEEHLPPILLISRTPSLIEYARTRAVLSVSSDLEIKALFIGEWDVATTRVDNEGRATAGDPRKATTAAQRVGVLSSAAFSALLATLFEAHTGHRPPATEAKSAPDPRPAHIPEHRTDDEPSSSPSETLSSSPTLQARETKPSLAHLKVFGSPRVENLDAPGKPLRAKAVELAVWLACHRDGADTRGIGEHLVPDVRLHNADMQIHTIVSNLRHVFGRAAGPRRIGYVVKSAGRYRLDPDTVEVDLWQLQDLLRRATSASSGDRTELLRQACDAYSAPLADGCDYAWVEPLRERARQQALDAHLLLAEDLLADDPKSAAGVLDKAIRIDKYNEKTYAVAMRARHRLSDRDGIRMLLRALTSALLDIDAAPDESTVQLADRLCRTLDDAKSNALVTGEPLN